MKTEEHGRAFAPTRVLEMLEWRFGAFDALARAMLGATVFDPDMRQPMDADTAWAILEFGDDLRQASEATAVWMERQRCEVTAPEAVERSFSESTEREGLRGHSDDAAHTGEGTADEPGVVTNAVEQRYGRSHAIGEDNTAHREPLLHPVWRPGSYERAGSEQRSSGSVSVSGDSWWSATLSVPTTGNNNIVCLHLERRSVASVEYPGDDTVGFLLVAKEIDAVLTLLQGVVTQARRDGVLHDSRRGSSTVTRNGESMKTASAPGSV